MRRYTDKNRETDRQWYLKNKEWVKERTKARRKRIKEEGSEEEKRKFKETETARYRRHYAKHRDEIIEKKRAYYATHSDVPRNYYLKNVTKMLWKSAKKRATGKGIDFEITVEDIPKIPDICPALGIPIIIAKGRPNNNSPTMDRIDNTKGYVKDNIEIISWRANTLKKDGNLTEFEGIVKYLQSKLPQGDVNATRSDQ